MKTVKWLGKPYFNIARDEADYFLRQGCKVVRDASGDTIRVLLAVGQRVSCDAGHHLMLAPGLVASAVTMLKSYEMMAEWEIEVMS